MRRLSSFSSPSQLSRAVPITASLILHALITAAAAAISSDGLALLAFKSAVSGDPSSALASWTEDADPCHWPGVSCANLSSSPEPNRVVAIAMAGKNLSGYIPSELGSLVYLRRLNLHGNLLSGSIPSELFNATSLHSLFLYNNNLSGTLPATLCSPPRLQNLDLSRNSISGTIPPELRECRQLQRLFLAQNRLSGRIPAGIWPELAGLIQLDISSNKLNGPLPPDIGDLNSLTGILNLSNNYFSGAIPKSLGNIPPAVILDLSYNNFSGEIPQFGSLAGQGPSAFVRNPALCGFPLKIPCSDEASAVRQGSGKTSPVPELSPHRKKGLRPGLIMLISMADAAGVSLAGLILVYVCWKVRDRERASGCSCTGNSKLGGDGNGRAQWCCVRCWNAGELTEEDDEDREAEGSTVSVGNEAGEGRLVSLDKGFKFELDELLRASAYVLGKGGLGIIYKVVLGNGVPVTVRRLSEGGGVQRFREFAGEVQAVAKARHPNVVRLRAFYWAPDEKLLISDFIPNGNLAAALRGRSAAQSGLTWPIRLRIAKGAARGLAFLHEFSTRRFVHGDIKPSNILLGNDYNPFISDFGLARLLSVASASPNDSGVAVPFSSSSSGGFLGPSLPTGPLNHDRPNPYRAPEARDLSARSTQRSDVYSFGVVLLELLTGRQPETAPPPSATMSAPGEKPDEAEMVRWARDGFEAACPLDGMVDPALRGEVRAEELGAAFRVAVACTGLDPEARPKMKFVVDCLDRIGQ